MEFFDGEKIRAVYLEKIKGFAYSGHVLGRCDDVVRSMYCTGLLALFRDRVNHLDEILMHVGKIAAGFSNEQMMYQFMVNAMKTDDIFWDDFYDLIEGDIAFQFCMDVAILGQKVGDDEKEILDDVCRRFDVNSKDCISAAKIIEERNLRQLLYFTPSAEKFKISNLLVYFGDVFSKRAVRSADGYFLKYGKWVQEDILWQLLQIKDGNAFLVSRYGLDNEPFHRWKDLSNTCWEKCTLRSWLNTKFLNSAFSDVEKNVILMTTVGNTNNPEYDVYPGRETRDKIFLLSISEVLRFFDSDEQRKCRATKFALSKDVSIDSDTGCACWWLRSPGDYGFDAAEVDYDGCVDYEGTVVISSKDVVRPAMWIDLNKLL